jgi:hypothetical protein
MYSFRVGTVAAVVLAAMLSASVAGAGLGRVGVYVYESVESYHSAGATAGTAIATALLPLADSAIAFDRIPLQSNETVRILSEMTKGREIVMSAVVATLAGGIIASPTMKMADDDIKFKDLTWHVDYDAVVADATKRGLTHVIVGTATGQVREAADQAAKSGSKLISVTVQVNLQLIDMKTGGALWAKSLRHVQAGFDPRVAFDEGLLAVSEKATTELTEAFGAK